MVFANYRFYGGEWLLLACAFILVVVSTYMFVRCFREDVNDRYVFLCVLVLGAALVIVGATLTDAGDNYSSHQVRVDLEAQGYKVYSVDAGSHTATVGPDDNDNCRATVAVVRNQPTGQWRGGVVTQINGQNQLVELKDLPILTEAKGC